MDSVRDYKKCKNFLSHTHTYQCASSESFQKLGNISLILSTLASFFPQSSRYLQNGPMNRIAMVAWQ